MAKHKRKKSPSTPDPQDSNKKKNTEEKENDIPPTENDIPPTENDIPPTENDIPPTDKKKIPKTENIPAEEETSETKQKLDRLFWLRIGLAVIAGTSATFIFDSIEGEERRWASIGFMILIFIASIIIAKNMNLKLSKSNRKKIVTQAIGSYIFLYLFVWIVSYTLVNAANSGTVQPLPFP